MPKLVSFLLSAIVASSSLAQTPPSKPADELARRSFDVTAGPAWEKARYFEFTFVVEHGKTRGTSAPERWDRNTGLYRVSGRDAKQNDFVVVMNVSTKKGRAWLNGEEVHDRRLDETLDLAYRRFLNDTYWLLMPIRMLDQGVVREAMGERTDSCGRTWDVVKVTSSGDTAFAWINRDTGLVEEWDMRLAGAPAEAAAVQVMFHDYARYGGLLISTRREVRNSDQTIRIEGLKVSSDVPKGAFEK
jgi:hypothetical protein